MSRPSLVTRRSLAAIAVAPIWIAKSQAQQLPRVAVVTSEVANDPYFFRLKEAFDAGLREHGWKVGQTVQVDFYPAGADPGHLDRTADVVVQSKPDVAVAMGMTIARRLYRASRTIPLVFVHAVDPVGAGLVESLSRPGGNATGFANYDYSLGGKWLELLHEIAPEMRRVLVLMDPTTPTGPGMRDAVLGAARQLQIEATTAPVREALDMERRLVGLAESGGGGVIVLPSSPNARHRARIIDLCSRHRLPATYPWPVAVLEGGLMSYGNDQALQLRTGGADYVSKILRGAKPADLPVQTPTRFNLIVNLRTAASMGLPVPGSVLHRADELIE